MRALIASLLLGSSLVLAGCGSSGNDGIEGAWRGTLTWADDAGSQSVFWSVFQNPASPGRPDAVRWTLRLENTSGCKVDLDFGLLAPEDDGSITFPVATVTAERTCFPGITADALGSNRLELALAGTFVDDTDAASGTAVLRARDSAGNIVTEFLNGEWDAVQDQ